MPLEVAVDLPPEAHFGIGSRVLRHLREVVDVLGAQLVPSATACALAGGGSNARVRLGSRLAPKDTAVRLANDFPETVPIPVVQGPMLAFQCACSLQSIPVERF
jgi:hypothetical protein